MMRWLAAFALVLTCAVSQARADSWVPAQRETYLSPDERTRLTVIPRGVDTLAYFKDKVAKKEPAGQAPGETRTTAHAVLERRGETGGWTRIWEAPLVNEVAPVSALVANGGQYVVTFDNWHAVGYGPDVVVIYGADGRHVRSFALVDLLPGSYVRGLPRTVSSLWWGGEHRLSSDGRQLILSIVVPSDDAPPDAREMVEIAIDLASAKPVPPSGPAWERALAQARKVAQARKEAVAPLRVAFAAPLGAPRTADEAAWSEYLRGAFMRLDPRSDVFPRAFVLEAPGRAGHRESQTALYAALRNTDHASSFGNVLLLASLAPPDQFVQILRDGVQPVRPGTMKDVHVYVAIPAAWRDQVAAILAPTGAAFTHIDPAVPIPQDPQRLADLRAAEAEEAAEEARESAPRP
ncbi:hypothetical protein [Sphingomonas sp.]|uniref:hypothetical protein n=1 Tax=Sphingomonas sp. TaxID=28214 RepID=UPI0031E08025